MVGTTKIGNFGEVNLKGVSLGDGQIEVHVPIDDASDKLESVVDNCIKDYMKKNKNVKSQEDILFDVRIVFSFGGFSTPSSSEFTILIIIWQESNEETAECYCDIPVNLDTEDITILKKIIWDSLGEAIFDM